MAVRTAQEQFASESEQAERTVSPRSAPLAGFSGTRRVPPPVNEPVKSYAPKSPERAELKAKLNPATRAQLLQAMPNLKERAKTLLDLIDGAYFIFADRPLQVEPKAAALASGHG